MFQKVMFSAALVLALRLYLFNPNSALADREPLSFGSHAPSLPALTWIRGSAIPEFKKGDIYVVEFWGTWCGPCLKAIPHLIELQGKYGDTGVHVLGIAAHEYPGMTQPKMDHFIAEKFPHINYPIAWDQNNQSQAIFLDPAGEQGIPTTFVIDRDGTLAFIGQPDHLQMVLPLLLEGKWRASEQARLYFSARDEEKKAEAEVLNLDRDLFQAVQTQDWEKALDLADQAFAQPNSNQVVYVAIKIEILLSNIPGRDQEGIQLAQQWVDQHQDDPWPLYFVLEKLCNIRVPTFAYHSELATSTAHLILEHIKTENYSKSAALFYPVLAQFYYKEGNSDHAIELIEKSLIEFPAAALELLGPELRK